MTDHTSPEGGRQGGVPAFRHESSIRFDRPLLGPPAPGLRPVASVRYDRPDKRGDQDPVTAILGISAFYHDKRRRSPSSTAGSSPRCRREPLLSQEARPGLPEARRRLLPGRGAALAGRAGLRRLLRQAADQVRAPDRDLSRLRPRRPAQLPPGHPGLAQGEALPAQGDPEGGRRLAPPADRLQRPPREPRRQRLLPEPLRRGGDRHAGRRRRVVDDRLRHRLGEPNPAHRSDYFPALARPPLFGLHLLLRVQGQ